MPRAGRRGAAQAGSYGNAHGYILPAARAGSRRAWWSARATSARACTAGATPSPAPLGTLRLGRANLRTGQKTPHALSAAILDPDARALSALWFGETRIVEYGAWCAGTTSAQRAAAVRHRVPPPFVRLSEGNSCWRAWLPSLSDASRFRLPYGGAVSIVETRTQLNRRNANGVAFWTVRGSPTPRRQR